MKNFFQFLLAILASLVFLLGWPHLWAEVALAVFAAIALLGESKIIAAFEVVIPIIVIILFNHRPDLWLLCLALSIFLVVWNTTEFITTLKEKLK